MKLSTCCGVHTPDKHQKKQPLMNMEEITSELIPVEDAQHLRVHKFSKFFSPEDIQTVLDFRSTNRQTLVNNT